MSPGYRPFRLPFSWLLYVTASIRKSPRLLYDIYTVYYTRSTAFLPVPGTIDKVELELDGVRVPFLVGASDLVAQHEAMNRLILSLDSDQAVTTPVMPTTEIANGGVYFIDPTSELWNEIVVVSYR